MAKEFSWVKAFSYAFRYIMYIILWVIIGGVIMIIGVAMMPSAISFEPPYYIPRFNLGAMIIGIILIVIGIVVIALGSMAAYFKIMSRLVNEASPKPPPQT